VILYTVDDAREFFSRLCSRRGISGYAIEQGIMSDGQTNASGARHWVQGRQANVTLDTLLTLCEHFNVRLTIEEIGSSKKKKEPRTPWDWQSHDPTYKRLMKQGAKNGD